VALAEVVEEVAERVREELSGSTIVERLALADIMLARSSLGQVDRLLGAAQRAAIGTELDQALDPGQHS
jgi:hypothetical protein